MFIVPASFGEDYTKQGEQEELRLCNGILVAKVTRYHFSFGCWIIPMQEHVLYCSSKNACQGMMTVFIARRSCHLHLPQACHPIFQP